MTGLEVNCDKQMISNFPIENDPKQGDARSLLKMPFGKYRKLGAPYE